MSVLQASQFPSLPLSDSGLDEYLRQVRQFPLLTFDEEMEYGRKFAEEGHIESAHLLVTSHLRLVVKIAMGYKGYGLPISDLISEGNIGLMQAVKRFDVSKGFRLTTYAMWWIRAAIQEYILHSWSLVKMGTTTAQKKLFFNLRKLRNQLRAYDSEHLQTDQVKQIAEELNVTEQDVIQMSQRLVAPDHSLNTPLKDDSQQEWQDWIADERPDQETLFANKQELGIKRSMLLRAMEEGLNEREKNILIERRLSEKPKTLEDLSEIYKISRERVRQIETRAFEKVQEIMLSLADEERLYS